MEIRKIRPEDNSAMASIIRAVMRSFDCVGEGYSIEDAEVDDMYSSYNNAQSIYYVIVDGKEVLGGAGVAPLEGGDADTCELKKMYFSPQARGRGMGRAMMEKLLDDAARLGYSTVYLETVERMKDANRLYQKFGFNRLEKNLGGTGHSGCDFFYAKEL